MNSWAGSRWLRLAVLLWCSAVHVGAETLTPPYFNLAEGKTITASATCGVDTEGPELYCKLIGANSDKELNVNVIQGQYCDVCDPSKPEKMHPPEYAVDGIDTWWQSPPLSRGMKYNEVNLTIDLGQEFHVAYVYIKMANSPRPGLWILEKSADYGKTYTPWQYFSDSHADCETYFGKESLLPITRDDSVICSTEYSKIVPLEEGEIPISLLNNRPSANHYFNSTVLQEWTRATNVRFRFLRTKNLLGHLMSVAKQDPTVTRRYFYSIKDISIGGRCMCNGHAQTCDIADPKDKVLLCRCQHNTCGAKCDSCCPGFEQKAWRQSKHNDPFRCEPCNCFNHSDECVYDPEVDKKHLSLDIFGKFEGGGVCQNCRHNTEGINCNKCQSKFYRPYNKHWNETDVCQPCNCNHFAYTGNCEEGSGRCECREQYTSPDCTSCSYGYYSYPECKACECFQNGTVNAQCSDLDGQCSCLHNFGGQYCKQCAEGYYNFPECTECECDPNGIEPDQSCNQKTGDCPCKNNFSGKQCDQCKDGYWNYPDCLYCSCDKSGTTEEICDKGTGKCFCKEGYGGERCDQCQPGYFGFPDCQPCNCSKVGSHGTTCSATGKCSCLSNYAGRTCEQCSPGYYNFPECRPCDCESRGSNGITCDSEGKCECLENFAGQHCDSCKEGYYNYPACEGCNCHPAGVVTGFAGCGSVPAGELCECKDRVEGRICNKCKPLFWNLNSHNPEGCEECNCNPAGVLGGIAVCDGENGNCICKPSVIARDCTECEDGTYMLDEDNLFGCSDCGCDVGGSVSSRCDKNTGNCTCQARVTGRTCKEPLATHYFPTLYQYQYEVEDGYTPETTRVRYAHDENVFANYSWKGYAVFSLLQKEVQQNIYIYKPSLYRMVIRFVNPNNHTVIGNIRVTPDNPNDNEQLIKVQFRNTSKPTFVTVSGESGNTPRPFVLNPGRWTVGINVNESVLLDYFVLLPEEYYLATVLTQKVETPCKLGGDSICRHYAYPNITMYDRTNGVGGFVINSKNKPENVKEFFDDRKHLSEVDVLNRVPLLNEVQNEINYNMTVRKPGAYVILVNYVTPLTNKNSHKIEIIADQKSGPVNGILHLYNCPYTFMCRQVVTNLNGGVGVFQVEDNDLPVKLIFKGSNTSVGIHTIYLIPYEDWSVDYIQPRPVCIRKDGKCIESKFRNPPETKKIQFETDVEGEIDSHRPPIEEWDNNTAYIWLNPNEKSIDLRGKVPSPGPYTFVLHYYQPHFPEFDLEVIIQNGQFYEAKVPVKHCPSQSGCRATIVQADQNNKFSLTENFMITLKVPDSASNKNVYLDYLLVIPADLYNDMNLQEEDFDRTGEFITTCGNDNFNIDTSKEGFCRDSVFSITAAHNVGALPCQCDYYGSWSFECEKFGGQCNCKPNIIGRKCEACKTGYYGFPNCQPCNCPSTAYCEPSTGRCICPENVVGEKCDQCAPMTFGFDPLIGCEECRCNPLGVEGHQMQCDLYNGSCECKPNVIGRTCDVCRPGHYAFPYCEVCDCDPSGTTVDICAQDTAECFCKKNVVGPQCNYCREGTYNLEPANEDGCTQCFCFGKTTRCYSSNLIKIQLMETRDWEVVSANVAAGQLNVEKLNLTVETNNYVGVDFSSFDAAKTTAYFSAPFDYLGKKLTAYGGYLNYTIFYVIDGEGNGVAIDAPDVILRGANTYLTHSSYEQPPPSQAYNGFVKIVENNFQLPQGVPAKKEHIMEVLKDLKGIYIRATYWTASITTRLTNPTQDLGIAYEHQNGQESLERAVTVEQCECPPMYQGLSCEECAPGYYRVDGPHGGYCEPCDCHGHATECDVETGICINCTHNTKGDHCEFCETGYHGNALAGTPRDCLICACPLPIASNNFATSCDLSNDGNKISCECEPGYFGARCESCAAGYYGRPEVQGDYCKPCQCSGNIDTNEPGSCDTVTGECLKCLNNTFGEACSLCAPGYFGDAIHLKDCQACICDKYGTDHCDSFNGICVCKENVIGEKCDRCQVKHYGFESGQGCKPCNCAEASDSDQCDDATGQCKCKEGVTGKNCDRCAAGYWNYTSEGCISCGCKSDFSQDATCNAITGQCKCLPGVQGEKCIQCPPRWAFSPGYGCHPCDKCHHALLDTTDELGQLIDPVIIEFDSTNSGYFTRRRLDNMRDILEKLKPKLDDVDPHQVSLTDDLAELDSLEQDSKNLNRKSNLSLDNSHNLKNQSEVLHDNVAKLYDEILLSEEEANLSMDHIGQITFELNEEIGAEVDHAILEAEDIFKQIQSHNFTGNEIDATKQLRKVNELLKNVTDFKLPSDGLLTDVDQIKHQLQNFKDKLDDLYNNTQYSLNKANEAEKILEKTGKDHIKAKLENIGKEVEQSKENVIQSQYLLGNASNLLDVARDRLGQLQDLPTSLDVSNNNFNTTLNNNNEALDELVEKYSLVENHAKYLSDEAEEIDQILSENKVVEDAVKAASAYQEIVKAVNNSRRAAEESRNDTASAKNILSGISDKTTEADDKSSDILDKAHLLNGQKDNLIPSMNSVKEDFGLVSENQEKNDGLLKEIEKILDNIHQKSYDEHYKNASETAEDANAVVSEVKDIVDQDFTELPNERKMVETLPKDYEEIRSNLLLTEKQIRSVNEKLPEVIDRVEKLPEKHEAQQKAVDTIQSKIKKLNQQIELARDMANKVKVGVQFYPNTTLELRNPDNLEELTTSIKMSGYFRTNKLDGIVFYLGNPVGTNLPKTKSDDYMSLVIVNGYPTLKFDIGNGPDQLINDKFVSDGVWYQYIIERIGHHATLTIREEVDGQIKETKAEKPIVGHYSIFNLDKDKSKLFVGSFPPTNYEIQKDIADYNSFEGEIEELVIGDRPVSLWNFNQGYENNHPAFERDKLLVLQPSTGFRFNGNGYAILNARAYPIRQRSDIQLVFKTFATEGLLFLTSKDKTFIALEMRNGKVLYQYNLGSGTKTIATSKQYNDGKWHKIVAIREGAKGRLSVDGQEARDVTKPISGSTIDHIETISFGGYPNKHNHPEVTEMKFDGCINNVTIMGQPVDLRVNIKTFDVLPGCPDKFEPMVSFSKQRPGYIGWDRISVANDFKIALKFKTKEKDGLIFYVTDNQQTAGISLALVRGHLKVISQKIELVSKDTFNDTKWHVVSVMHNDNELRVDFDDFGYKVTDSPPALHLLHGHMYVGGLPSRLNPLPGTVGSTKPFSGCIADLTLKGAVKNFANTTDRSNEYLASCLLDKTELDDLDVHKLPELPPLPDLERFTTTEAIPVTENPFGSKDKSRGDGGNDYVPPSRYHPIDKIQPVTEEVVKPEPEETFTNAPRPGHIGRPPPPTTKPPPKEGCALPIEPLDEGENNGFRFGTKEASRLEYMQARGKFKKQCDFDLEVRTSESDGVILYISDQKGHDQYMALLMQDGRLVFTFNTTQGPIVIRTKNRYDDDKFHYIEISRDGTNAKIVVDNQEKLSQSGSDPSLDLRAPFYIGGLPPKFYNDVVSKINMTGTFKGCIRNFNMNGKPMENPTLYDVIPCSSNVEAGTFFSGDGFVKLKEKFKVGIEFNVKMEIKPRNISGVILAVHGKKDYFVLEMINGMLQATVDNGKRPFKTIFKKDSIYSLCDGEWHSIQAVKSKNVITLSVDNVFTPPQLGDRHALSTDTGSALFIGGHRYIKRIRGIQTRTPYVGCVRNIYINNEPAEIIPTMINGKVNVGSCRTN